MKATQCPRCESSVDDAFNYCANCGTRLRRDGESDSDARERRESKAARRRRKRIDYVGQLVASALSGVITAMLALVLGFLFLSPRGGPGWFDRGVVFVTAAPFDDQTDRGTVNASALVADGDSRFLVVDDLTDDAFFELTFTPDGRKAGPLVRRPVAGLSSELVQDLEDATIVDSGGTRVIIAISSLEADEAEPTDAGLVRVTTGADGSLAGEVMPGFRNWLLSNYPALLETRGGADHLDVQGLAWDPRRSVLLVGARSATKAGKPLILPVRVRDWSGPWTIGNLERADPVELQIGDDRNPKGVTGLAWDERRHAFALIIGNAPPGRGSYGIYIWDGGDSGKVSRISDLMFDPRMRPEGIAFGTIGGRPASVVVDDNGGYYVFWQDEKGS